MILVLPCAGKSSRFPGVRPKFLLTHPAGDVMLLKSIELIDMKDITSIFIISLREYEDTYHFKDAIVSELKRRYPDKMINVELLAEPTRNQPETIYQGLLHRYLTDEPLLIKDCDNQFMLKLDKNFNSVAVGNLHDYKYINPTNKSYIEVGNNDQVVNIVEKQVVSPYFCAGAYYFKSVIQFKKYYKQLQHEDNLYISHIIYKMILDGEVFVDAPVNHYLDWGTLEDWTHYCYAYQTLFVDIDGVLVKSGGEGTWGKQPPLTNNIETLVNLFLAGYTHVVLTTSRPESYREVTEEQLRNAGMKWHKLVMGLPHCRRVLINDFAVTNPYPSAISINLLRDADNLKEYL